MALFAGPVFPEWYWGPIFFYLVFGLPLSAAALAADFAVRRWLRPLSWPQRAGLWVGVVAGGSLAILGGRAVVEHVRFEREAKAAAQKLDFTPYAADTLPAGFDEELVRADDFFGGPVLVSRYAVVSAPYAFAYQQRPREVSLQNGHCSLRQLVGTGTSFYDGPCRELRTPRGRAVFIGSLGISTEAARRSHCSTARSCASSTLRSPTATCSPTTTPCGRSPRKSSTSRRGSPE